MDSFLETLAERAIEQYIKHHKGDTPRLVSFGHVKDDAFSWEKLIDIAKAGVHSTIYGIPCEELRRAFVALQDASYSPAALERARHISIAYMYISGL